MGGFVWKWEHFSSAWAISFASLLPPLLWWKLRRELTDISTILQFLPASFLPWEICGLSFHRTEPQVIYVCASGSIVWELFKPISSKYRHQTFARQQKMNPKSFLLACNHGLVLVLMSVPLGMSLCQSNSSGLIDGVNNCHCCVPKWKVWFEDVFLTFALHQPLFSSSPCEGTIYIVLLHINFSDTAKCFAPL